MSFILVSTEVISEISNLALKIISLNESSYFRISKAFWYSVANIDLKQTKKGVPSSISVFNTQILL